jgi:O-antigen ligase
MANALTLPKRFPGTVSSSAPRKSGRTVLGLPAFQFGLLLQILATVAPPLIILMLGKPYYAGKLFWGLFILAQVRLAICGRRNDMLCLAIAATPAINLLRDYATYNIIVVLFGGCLAFYFMQAQVAFMQSIRRHPMIFGIFAFALFWYLGSYINTRDYSVNLRLFELVFTVIAMLIIGHDRVLLGSSLMGLCFSAVMVGAAMLPYFKGESVARLGIIIVDGVRLGNPTQLGIPLALSFLALIIDGGFWMNLKGKFYWRWPMLAPTFMLLALTTSRASWLVSSIGIATSIILGHKQRLKSLILIGVGALGVQAVLLSPFGHSFDRGLERTFSEDRTAAQRTSGRSDQWMVTYYAWTRSLNSLIAGYGPGRGAEIYAELSDEVEGVKYAVGKKVALHSLFMQIAVESGLIGLVSLISWLIYMFCKTLMWSLKHKLIFPFVCFLGYAFIVVTVSGNDVPSAAFLGTGILATGRAVKKRKATSQNAQLGLPQPAMKPI